MLKILSKKEIDDMTLFYKYINLNACPTDFSIASGLLDFSNECNLICSSYYVNDTNEMIFSRVLCVDNDGKYRYISKADKYYCGIRPALNYSSITSKSDFQFVNNDLLVCEYGYFPRTLIDKPKQYEDTLTKISLPTSENMLGKPKYYDFHVFKEKFTNNYFIEYPVHGIITRVRNKYFYDGEKGCFLIEPIRFWVDRKSDIAITQDVILGGVSYKMFSEMPYEYDDYYESDLYEALGVVEEDINILKDLILGNTKVKKKK